jgi:hypothetical protein
MQSTNEKTLVTASINADQEKNIWVAEPVLEYPEWDYECFHCGTETEEHEGYLRDGECYCDSCAYDLFDQPKPKSKYTDEMWDNFAGCQPPKDDVVCIIPDDAILIDNDYVYCKTYDEAKEILKRACCRDTDVVQDLLDAYIVSQDKGTFWFKLSQDTEEPTKFIICAYASKDEVSKKYIRRMLEHCMYSISYMINPEDYECQDDDDEDCATEEDMANFYREQEEEISNLEQKCMEQNDMDVDVNDYNNYYTNKALCVTCGEVNYAEPVCEVEGRSRMVCCDCIEIVNRCEECNNLTLDCLYLKENYNGVRGLDVDLCFNCKFNNPLKEEMPLWVCWAIRSSIQSLNHEQFDILTDYAELAQLTIFDAYRYKSRCHFYDCERMVPASQWDSEEKIQFCCRRHCELADLNGCHCQNVYDGSHYDEDYEQATCKVCNNANHETNMIPRIALRESDQGVKPIVSAICVFEEGIKMSDVLAESLVDLCEYFV